MLNKSNDKYHFQPYKKRKKIILIGRIMIYVPIVLCFIVLASLGIERGGNILFTCSIGIYTVFFCGLLLLLYAAIKKFQAGLRGEDD